MTVLDVYFVAAGEKASDRYNIVLIILYCTFSPWAQTWSLKDSRLQKVNVARNNSFRHTYSLAKLLRYVSLLLEGKRQTITIFLSRVTTVNLSLVYGDERLHKANVAWNNSFKDIFRCCWRESVRVSDRYNIYVVCYHCHTYQRRLLFWQKMLSDNVILLSLSRLSMDQFVAVGSQCGITTFTIPSHLIRSKIWDSFSSSECGLR